MSKERGAGTIIDGGEMGERIRCHDWAGTALGPIDTWPQSLRSALSILLGAQNPTFLLWGPELIQLYNDAGRPVLGSSKHPAALGQRSPECVPEIWPIIGPLVEHVMGTGESIWREDLLLPLERSGFLEECYFTFSYSAVRAEDGAVGGVWISCLETTARVIAGRRLAVLRELGARALVVQSTEAVCADAVRVLADAATDAPFAVLYLLASDLETPRLVCAGGIDAAVAGAASWPVTEVLRSGCAQVVELSPSLRARLPRHPWPEAPTRVLLQPILAPGEPGPTGVLVAGLSPRRAVDERYRSFFEVAAGQIGMGLAAARVHEAERRRAEALAEIDRAKTQFFGNVSHELRTPLTLLLAPLDRLRAGAKQLDDDAREAVDLAHHNGQRLLGLVNSLLDFARIGAGGLEPNLEPTDLATFTADLASGFESVMTQGGLRLHVDCPALDAPVPVDRGMWEKIVLNLLSNAFKFTLAGEVAVELRAHPGHVELRVRDTGVGIAASDRAAIFERFHRVRGARSRSQEGTGIGLSLSRDLVHLHHGTIEVDSREGVGSTFVVRIPRGREHAPALPLTAGESTARFVEEAQRWLPDREPAAPIADAGARILVADDSADMRLYLGRLLRGRGWDVELVADGAAALEAIAARPPSLLVTDAMMPEMDGFALVRRIREDPAVRSLPVVMLTARAGGEAVVDGLESGVNDYIVKPFRDGELLRRIEAALRLAQLREEAASYRGLVDHLVHGVGRTAASGGLIAANPALVALLGRDDPAEVLGIDVARQLFVDPLEFARIATPGVDVLRGEEVRLRRRDGSMFWGRLSGRALRGAGGVLLGCEFMVEDTSERRILEERVRQAQKMAAVGQLTGGIAHDFNNLLTAVIVNSDLALRALRRGRTTISDELETVRAAGKRGAEMVRKLMAFSRQRDLEPEPSDLGQLVPPLIGILRRVLPESIEIEAAIDPRRQVVRADPGAIEQMLVNLATNARDAMASGGVLRIATAPVELDAAACASQGWGAPGRYVQISVADDGIGMDDATRDRIFEPFFTTKEPGKGTGLGLAMVYVLMQQHHGFVDVATAPGRGTEVRLLFPLAVAESGDAPSHARPVPRPTGNETVLVVEDELMVREAARAVLDSAGYRVLVARDGHEASALLESGQARIDLVVTDVVMPRCNGAQLYAVARRLPRMPLFLFTSGYADLGSRPLPGGTPFLAKPWTDVELLVRVRDVLDGGGRPPVGVGRPPASGPTLVR